VTVALDEAGDGEPLVLLHGVGTNRGVWRKVLPSLAARHRTIAVDLPGFGDSPPAGDGFDLDAVADLVADAAIARARGPFDLLGHSLGGAIAVLLARRRPESVRRLVLLAPAGFSPRPRAVAAAAGLAGEVFVATRRIVGRPLAGSAPARRILLWGAVHDGGRLSTEDARFMLDASRRARRLRAAIEAVAACDLRPALAEVRAPLGLLGGEDDRVVSTGAARALAAARPDAPTETIAGCGHVPQLERPRELIAALERLLERLDAITDS
jgi:pimeloyl-ACP methyl ester carboxylesterase